MVSSIATAAGGAVPVPQILPPGLGANAAPAPVAPAKPDSGRGPAVVLGGMAELNAKLRAQALDGLNAAAKTEGEVTVGVDGMERRKVRDETGRVFEERRMRDPKTGRTMFLELAPTDGMGGKVSILVGNKSAMVSFSERDIGKVPWDLVGKALGEIVKEQELKAGDSFQVSMRVTL